MQTIQQYSFLKGILKTLVAVAIFGLPMLTTQFPEWANLTLGGLSVLIVNYMKVKAKTAGLL